MKNIYVTTSWDDGHILDMRVADLLTSYNLKGTFYIAPLDCEFEAKDRLTNDQILNLSKDFEIGAHTMVHKHLPTLSYDMAKYEITKSKITLEKILHKEVSSFCYPAGKYLNRDLQLVREAGYTLARTVKRFCTKPIGDIFEMSTTVHTYDHWSDIFKIAKFVRYNPRKFFKLFRRWDLLAIAHFDEVRTNGGIFHLWGHSWEIEDRTEWDRLSRVFAHISNHADVLYVSNSDLVKLYE